ncbi:MAG: hypothetical protein H6606_10380 [Flavobacteriales bacterium]|nr:hypothetical protein [Flavobacteriales bacterium]
MERDETFLTFNFQDILLFLFRWRKHLIIITVVAGVLGAVFSAPVFIKPKYRSEVVFYPTTINSIGNAMFTDLNKREADVLAFGEEEEAENALQILKSDKLTNRVVRNFDLMKHYKIDPNGSYPYTKLARKMKSNISYDRTRYLSIAITVMDEDPQMAADIANGIAAIYDSVKTEIQQQVAREAFVIVEEEFKKKEDYVWGLKTRLRELGAKGIINIDEQAATISDGLYKLYSSGGSAARIQQLQAERDTLAKYGSEYTNLYETLILELEELSQLRKRYNKAKVDIEKTLPHKFVLTNATPAEKKSYPVRKLIVLLSMVAGFAMGAIVLLFVEQRKKLKTA